MTQPLLCETVTGRTMADLRAARDRSGHADLVELRLDGVADVSVAGALEGRRLPVIVTCRPLWEGGLFDGGEEMRLGLLREAIALGAEYVDVEWRADFAGLVRSTGGARLVLSSHDFDGVPADVRDRCRAMRATGAEVVKMAVAATRLSDCLPLLDLTRDGRTVVIGMGAAGIATRILAARFGSCWTYAGHGIAPGQIPVQEMIRTYRFRQLREDTVVYGLAGNPVMQSLSPAMHNAAFEALGQNAIYLPLQALDFDDFMTFAERLPIAGASVTIPFKLDALRVAQQVDQVDDVARVVGAANTLKRAGRGWEATNTDVAGFLAPLTEGSAPSGFAVAGARAAVLGAGGAARAVVHGLISSGARVRVHARATERARDVAVASGADVGEWPPAPGSWDLLVNCTPLGGTARPTESPLPGGPFGGQLVYDLVYAPADTRLLREAREVGCATIGGLPMLVAQAERQFEWWTGTRPPDGVMARAAREAMMHGSQALRG